MFKQVHTNQNMKFILFIFPCGEDSFLGTFVEVLSMDIGVAVADDQTCYFIIGRQEKLHFGAKTTVQCSDRLKHKIALKFSKT